MSDTTQIEFPVKESFNFVDEILTQKSIQDMASLDVYSLFNNIPLAETNNISIKKLLQNADSLINGISKNESRGLLNLLTKESFFNFNSNFCTQANDVAVMSPLISILGEIFLPHLCPIKCKLSFY